MRAAISQKANAYSDVFMRTFTSAMARDRQGTFQSVRELGPFALAIGLLAITIAAVAIVLEEMSDHVDDGEESGTAYEVVQYGLDAMGDIGGWLGLIVLMGVLVIVFLFLGVIRRSASTRHGV